MREWINLVETFVTGFKTTYSRANEPPCEIFKNPTRAEYKICSANNSNVRAFLVGPDIYIWNSYTALHQTVREHLQLSPDVIPIVLYGKIGSESLAEITDNTRHTPLWHSPDVGSMVKRHPWLNKAFKEIEVHYYDQDIEGPWDELRKLTT